MTEPEQPTSGYGTYGNGDYGNGYGTGNGGTQFLPPEPIEDMRPEPIPPAPEAPPFAGAANEPSGAGQQPPYGGGQWQYGAGAPGGYQSPYYYGYGYPQQPGGTNGMAIAAMVCGLCGFLCLIPALVGLVLGLVSLPQIKRSGQNGRGMAITGIVAGALWLVGFVLLIVLASADSGSSVDTGASGGMSALALFGV